MQPLVSHNREGTGNGSWSVARNAGCGSPFAVLLGRPPLSFSCETHLRRAEGCGNSREQTQPARSQEAPGDRGEAVWSQAPCSPKDDFWKLTIQPGNSSLLYHQADFCIIGIRNLLVIKSFRGGLLPWNLEMLSVLKFFMPPQMPLVQGRGLLVHASFSCLREACRPLAGPRTGGWPPSWGRGGGREEGPQPWSAHSCVLQPFQKPPAASSLNTWQGYQPVRATVRRGPETSREGQAPLYPAPARGGRPCLCSSSRSDSSQGPPGTCRGRGDQPQLSPLPEATETSSGQSGLNMPALSVGHPLGEQCERCVAATTILPEKGRASAPSP